MALTPAAISDRALVVGDDAADHDADMAEPAARSASMSWGTMRWSVASELTPIDVDVFFHRQLDHRGN